jgi:hypothetical protein
VPTHLTPEQRAVLERFAAIEGAPPREAGAGKKFWNEVRRAFGA